MSDSEVANGVARLSAADAEQLSHQISGLVKAGMPIGAGLLALSEEFPGGRLRRSMRRLALTLESGEPLEEALSTHESRIPPQLRGLVIAGIRSGKLGDMLSRFSSYVSVGTEIRRRLWLNLIYPFLTALAATSLFVFISTTLVNQFELVFKDFGVPLPALTIAVIAISHFMRSVWGPVITVIVTLASCLFVLRFFLPPPSRRSLATRLPIVGGVWRSTSHAEFCHLLALLLESELPLPEALRLTGQGVQDADVDYACRGMAKEVEAGRTLSHAITARRPFAPGLPKLLEWGETNRNLPEVLHMAGSMFESRARSSSTFAGTVVSVLCVFLVLSMVMIIPALFLPLITLIGRLSG
jgi:general secretion pathway protein F